MKILITNYSLYNYAGTENYVVDIAKYFHDKGHLVVVYSSLVGKVGKTLQMSGICVVDDITKVQDVDFDVIHAHHNNIAIYTRLFFPNTPMVFVSHGVLPQLEQPPHININIALFVAVSEEVQNNLKERHGISQEDIAVVRNFVDFERFCEVSNINATLKRVLVISNHYTKEVRDVISKSCADLEISLMHVGYPDNAVENVEESINDADLVIALGKGVLESLACKRNVIVYDQNGSDGFMTKELYYESRKNNFSGRRYEKKLNQSQMTQLLKKYNPAAVNELHDIIRKNHLLENVCEKLLESYKTSIELHKKLSDDNVLKMKRKIFISKDFYVWKIMVWYLKIRHRKKLVQIKE